MLIAFITNKCISFKNLTPQKNNYCTDSSKAIIAITAIFAFLLASRNTAYEEDMNLTKYLLSKIHAFFTHESYCVGFMSYSCLLYSWTLLSKYCVGFMHEERVFESFKPSAK